MMNYKSLQQTQTHCGAQFSSQSCFRRSSARCALFSSLRRHRHVGRGSATVVAGLTAKEAEELETDKRKLEERESWYVARFVADDAPDWNAATFVSSRNLANGLDLVELDIEIGRERVPLRNAYRHVGQRASIRVNNGPELELLPASAPFSIELQQDPLYMARNDLTAGQTKQVVESTTVTGRLQVLVPEGEGEDLLKASAADLVEVGPFRGTGLNLRGPIIGMFTYRTIIIFAEGPAIATAKALIEAPASAGGLGFLLREDARLYYRAPNDASLAFKDEFAKWESEFGVKTMTATRDAFIDMFDDDDTLAYEPVTTAAIILVNGDEEAEKAALMVCSEAEITEIVKDSEQQEATEYLSMSTNVKV